MKLNVLSLFDGMSCGQMALERAGIEVGSYFASEIDETAIAMTQKNYPDTIQLGSVVDVKASDLPKIDLLIGGSPCQGFSFIGARRNFNDPRSALFFEYVRLLEELTPTYFLLENVLMEKNHQNTISNYLDTQPFFINSNVLSAASRSRLYWTNFFVSTQIEDKGITFDDINTNDQEWLDDSFIEKIKGYNVQQNPVDNAIIIGNRDKLPCILASMGTFNLILIFDKEQNKYRRISAIELERAMTVPDDYTSGHTYRKRKHALGNGWTVDVITHIFNHLHTPILKRSLFDL